MTIGVILRKVKRARMTESELSEVAQAFETLSKKLASSMPKEQDFQEDDLSLRNALYDSALLEFSEIAQKQVSDFQRHRGLTNADIKQLFLTLYQDLPVAQQELVTKLLEQP